MDRVKGLKFMKMQESDWTDCSDAVIDCSRRTCGMVCAYGRLTPACTHAHKYSNTHTLYHIKNGGSRC